MEVQSDGEHRYLVTKAHYGSRLLWDLNSGQVVSATSGKRVDIWLGFLWGIYKVSESLV